MSAIRLSVTGPEVELSAFDQEVSVVAAIAVMDADPGTALVPGRLLANIVRSLPNGSVRVLNEGQRIRLTCADVEFALPTYSADLYPLLPGRLPATGAVVGRSLGSSIQSVATAASRDDTSPELAGMLIEVAGEKLTLAATDRYRIAVATLDWSPKDSAICSRALVPAQKFAEAAKSMMAEPELALALPPSGGGSPELLGLAGGGRWTTTRLLGENRIPDYGTLLRREWQVLAVVDTERLLEAVRRVALVASDTSPVHMNVDHEQLVLTVGGPDGAAALEKLPSKCRGGPVAIAFRPSTLYDGVNAISSDATWLKFTTSDGPAMITRSTDSGLEDDSFRYALTPVRT